MTPKINGIYKHFKGNLYRVIAIAKHSETGQDMVVYQALYDNYDMYVRPYESFVSPVDHVKYPDVTQEYRFEPVPDPSCMITGKDAFDQSSQNGQTDNMTLVSAKENAAAPMANCKDDTENFEKCEEQDESGIVLRKEVEEFLDTDSLTDKHNILVRLRDSITQDEITIMSTVMDIEIDDSKSIDERYEQLMKCIDTMQKFETNRLR